MILDIPYSAEAVAVLKSAENAAKKEGKKVELSHLVHAILRSETREGDRLRKITVTAFNVLEPVIKAGITPAEFGFKPYSPPSTKNPKED